MKGLARSGRCWMERLANGARSDRSRLDEGRGERWVRGVMGDAGRQGRGVRSDGWIMAGPRDGRELLVRGHGSDGADRRAVATSCCRRRMGGRPW
ncbi:hypothetical protein ACLOJK_011521 [Asimina triloba]